MQTFSILFALVLLLTPLLAQSGEADVMAVDVSHSGGLYRFEVTIQHEDTGWQHYTNKWEVLAEDGSILATRVLYHPHVDEQPFTRSLSGVQIPPGTRRVTLRAHDLVHQYGGQTMSVEIPGIGR